MIAPGAQDPNAREIARGLATAIQAVLGSAQEPASIVWNAAGEIAELLQLTGLSALLQACRAHAAHPPADVSNAMQRLARLASATEEQGSLSVFEEADRELAALAAQLAGQSWGAPSGAHAGSVPVQSLAELLADLEVEDRARIARGMLSLPVAAGLRAALDWLGAGTHGALRVTLQDAVVTISMQVEHEPGLSPAGAVLSLTGGALLPEDGGRWAIRAPLFTERPAYLLARQGALALAVPWHAVARLRLATEAARGSFAEPSLEPWSPLARVHGERPAVLLAQGLQHAWLHLDHIVWRVFAASEPAMGPVELPGLRQGVNTPDGETWWVVALQEALADVPPLPTPPGLPRRREEPAPTVEPTAEAEAVAATGPETPVAGPEASSTEVVDPLEPSPRLGSAGAALVVLGRENVRPIDRPRAAARRFEPRVVTLAPEPAVVPPPVPAPAPVTPAELGTVHVTPIEPAPVAPAKEPEAAPRPARALIADDSLVARLAIARVLEQEGWQVEMVERAAQMWHALEDGGFDAVFVDVALPDASGREHLRELVARQLVTAERFEVIALPRDGAEAQIVRDCGIARALRKPFAKGAVEALVGALRPADRA